MERKEFSKERKIAKKRRWINAKRGFDWSTESYNASWKKKERRTTEKDEEEETER